MTAAGRTFGRRLEPDHDERSRAFLAPQAVVLRTVLHERQGPVLDQEDIGACTGFAAAGALNTGPLRTSGRPLLTSWEAAGLYAVASTLDPWDGSWPGQDTGSSGLAVAKAARKGGLVSGYRHAFGINQALAALVLGPVLVGIAWHEAMMDPDEDGLLHAKGPIVGGHEVCLIGLDVDAEQVTVLNSWGSSWGNGGTARMRWATLADLLADGGDATVLVRAA